MGFKFKKCFKCNRMALVLFSIGLGMILSIIIPFWVWIVVVGGSLIIYAVRELM